MSETSNQEIARKNDRIDRLEEQAATKMHHDKQMEEASLDIFIEDSKTIAGLSLDIKDLKAELIELKNLYEAVRKMPIDPDEAFNYIPKHITPIMREIKKRME